MTTTLEFKSPKDIENKPGGSPFEKSDDKRSCLPHEVNKFNSSAGEWSQVEYRAYMKDYGGGGSTVRLEKKLKPRVEILAKISS